MIPRHFVQDLLDKLDIVDVVEQHLPLKKAGANFVACCPFHNEKTPSFTVSQSKQFYHCFGCGAHGTAITFVMEHTGQGFVEAVEQLAHGIGLEVPREQSAEAVRPKVAADLYELMQQASRFYREQLKQSPSAIAYLKQRGLSGEIAARFGIGYAPDAWQSLQSVFPNYQSEALSAVGLVIDNESGRRYDRFRDRIMFPIINVKNQVIGFGGRVLDKGEPKYLNSPETTLFEKGRELYGLAQAQKAIRSVQRVLVVEGYMDVVALAQHGIDYVVATLGTATTPFHIQKLFRLTDQIVFCFDGDMAGQKAAWRALENTLPQLQDGKRISFLFLPTEHDPDSFVREFGREEFEERVQQASPLSGYLLGQISHDLDLYHPEGRDLLLQRAKPLLMSIEAPALSLLLRKEVAALAGVSQAELEGLYGLAAGAKTTRAAPRRVVRMPPSAHRALLQCLLAQPQLISQLPEGWHGEGVDAEAVKAVWQLMLQQEGALSTAALIQYFQDTSYAGALVAAEAEILNWGEEFDVGAEFAGLLLKYQQEQRLAQFQILQDKIARMGLSSLGAEERAQYLKLLQR